MTDFPQTARTVNIRDTGTLRALFSSIRYKEVLVLQGTPCMGVIFSAGNIIWRNISPIALFAAASFLLVAHIWTLNDWADSRSDQHNAARRAGAFSNRGIAASMMFRFSIALLMGSLGLFFFLPARTMILALVVATLGFVYSFPGVHAKRTGLLASMTHFAGGAFHFLLGYSLFAAIDRRAMLIAPFFALVFTAGHATQEVQDCETDLLAGIRTNAVVFGKRRVFIAAFAGFGLAYAYLACLALAGVVPARLVLPLLLLFPLHCIWSIQAIRGGLASVCMDKLRNQYRVLFALIGADMISTLFW